MVDARLDRVAGSVTRVFPARSGRLVPVAGIGAMRASVRTALAKGGSAMSSRIFALVVSVVTGLGPSLARADTGPFSGIYTIWQRGQDVVLRVLVPECRITRTDTTTGEVVEVCDGHRFTEEENKGTGRMYCSGSGVIPQGVDCDDDGLIDCYSQCEWETFFDVVDPCVPPGEYEYATPGWGSMGSLRGVFPVSNSGDPCLGDLAEAIAPFDGGEGGCSVTTSRPEPVQPLLLAVMLGIGLAAALRRPRRPRP
jgi:MYXO-CTERM domain-containing protein